MKGKSQQRAIFLQIGKALTHSKPKSRKQTHSFFQINAQNNKLAAPSTAPNIYKNPISTKRKISLPYPAKINTTALVSGMNDEFLYMRKQNHLNTCFNVRKNKLKQISRQNKQIHKRLNSQKSMYSSIDLNKSFQSTSELKKRLSQSKQSQRINSSRSSSREGLNSGGKQKRLLQKKKDQVQIKASNINNAKRNDLKSFQALFSDKPGLIKQNTDMAKKLTNYATTNNVKGQITLRQNYGKTVPTILNHNQREVPLKMGNMLHRIAQVMYTEEKIQPKRAKGYMQPKKTFVF